MTIRFLLLSLCFLVYWNGSAQDQNFTQFYASPLLLNPALTGAYSGKIRLGTHYRDQWRGALDDPYVTFGGFVDVKFPLELGSKYQDAVAIGLMFFNDRVPGIDFSTNQMALSASFHKALDFDNRQFLMGGIQFGLAQRNINYEDLTFDDQFNSIDGYTLNTGEFLPANNFSYSDFAVGVNYVFAPKKRTLYNVGFAMHHVLEPDVSFFSSLADPDNGVDFEDSPLFRKYSVQLSAQFPVSNRMSLVPRLLVASQGPHLGATVGTNLRYQLNDWSGNAIQFGTWLRPVRDVENAPRLDAIVFLVGLEISNVLFGLSYDVNLDDVVNYQQGQGAFEFSIIYLGEYDNESILCPSF